MDNVMSLLGIAYKARKLILGEDVLNNLNKVCFLFIASDASDNTKERYLKKCTFYNIPYTTNYTASELTKAIGKNNCKIIGTCDKGFGKTFTNKLK